jgi:bifunctional UDP-N-acetylglucosamine pyrophosphorylase / glucosamine-1-phosphate N-acetyltransferase
MKSGRPKHLHTAAGRPILAHLLDALKPLPLRGRMVVCSTRVAEIRDAMDACGFGDEIDYVVQEPPSGTADATRVALEALDEQEGTLLVLPGDIPLIQTSTIEALLHVHFQHSPSATLLTARISDPTGYGRVVRSGGRVEKVVEDQDATYEERAIDEINAGVYLFDIGTLSEALSRVESSNAQDEYYLTDVITLLRDAGREVQAYRTHPQEILGVNSRAQLALVSGLLRRSACERWMDEGVTIVDPSTTYIDASVSIERDAIIHPFTFLEGATRVAESAQVGPQTRVVDSLLDTGCQVSFSVVVESIVGPDAWVGPFASLRPGTVLERGAKIGTFVEAKNSRVGEESKVNHLSYVGDAQLGRGVNVGAGSITCNWDGSTKNQTFIEDDAYISSDTMLVAPVRIGKRAATGAGAVVTEDVPDDALAVGMPARILRGRGDRMKRKNSAGASDPSE